MGDGWGLERTAWSSIFCFPVSCGLLTKCNAPPFEATAPSDRTRDPVTPEGDRARPGWSALSDQFQKTDGSFRKQCRHKEREESHNNSILDYIIIIVRISSDSCSKSTENSLKFFTMLITCIVTWHCAGVEDHVTTIRSSVISVARRSSGAGIHLGLTPRLALCPWTMLISISLISSQTKCTGICVCDSCAAYCTLHVKMLCWFE